MVVFIIIQNAQNNFIDGEKIVIPQIKYNIFFKLKFSLKFSFNLLFKINR